MHLLLDCFPQGRRFVFIVTLGQRFMDDYMFSIPLRQAPTRHFPVGAKVDLDERDHSLHTCGYHWTGVEFHGTRIPDHNDSYETSQAVPFHEVSALIRRLTKAKPNDQTPPLPR